MRLGREQARAGALFVAPAMVLFAVFMVLPVLGAFFLSFTDYDILTPPRWTGLGNYARLLDDVVFMTAMKNILLYCLMFVPAMIVLSLLLALALNLRLPGMVIYKTVFFVPVVTSPVAAATVWGFMLNGHYGPVNELLRLIGIEGPAWLGDSDTAMASIVLVTLWQGVGWNMLIYLAGLQGIPAYLYEAAAIDGAGRWQAFRRITWPARPGSRQGHRCPRHDVLRRSLTGAGAAGPAAGSAEVHAGQGVDARRDDAHVEHRDVRGRGRVARQPHGPGGAHGARRDRCQAGELAVGAQRGDRAAVVGAALADDQQRAGQAGRHGRVVAAGERGLGGPAPGRDGEVEEDVRGARRRPGGERVGDDHFGRHRGGRRDR
ncbi:ABC transporter permease subunit [Nonomuraea sp. NPDC049480]|uniref:ABC transporter permease subunit n=1 Tax=Nonomuraea sp. NPDC049480 TaxID=3364353 RepID=UPI00379D3290